MPRHAPNKTLGEDTSHKFIYSVSVGPLVTFDAVIAFDAYDAERLGKQLYRKEIGPEPGHEARATFTGMHPITTKSRTEG